MKRKTFGRFAAAGMAAVSAISAVSIVASADLVSTGKKSDSGYDYVKGISYKVAWRYNAIAYTFSLNDKNEVVANPGKNILGAIGDGKKIGEKESNPAMANEVYFSAEEFANARKQKVDNAVEAVEDDYDEEYSKWQALAQVKKWYDNFTENPPKLEDGVSGSQTLKNGKTLYYYKAKNSGSGKDSVHYGYTKEPTENDVNPTDTINATTVYVLSGDAPAITKLNESQLMEALGQADININTSGEITTIDPNYTIDTSSNTSTGSSGNNNSYYYDGYNIPSSYRYGSYTSYRVDGIWYPNSSAASWAGSWTDSKSSYWNPNSSSYYFDPENGYYYTYAEVQNGYHPYAYRVDGDYDYITESDYAVYKVGSLYYYNWSEAYSAAGGNRNNIKYVRSYTSRGNYFSRTTGYFYSSYYDALTASGGNSARVVTLNGTSYVDPYSDPSYYWFMNGGSSNSNANLGGSSVKIGNRNGWNYVRNYVAAAKSGATLNVSLNGETTIPSAIMSALDGKNVTVNFTLSNGSVISFNGKDISDPKEVSVNVVYNAKEVPSKLVAKAKSVNDGVSTAQLTISSNTFGGEAGLNVKFNANREGYTAKIYRYNSTKNSLQYIDKGTINSSGRVSFDGLTQGGEYVIVVC